MISPELTQFLSSLKTVGIAQPKGDHPEMLSESYYQDYHKAESGVFHLLHKLGLDTLGMSSNDFAGIIKYAASEGWPVPEEKIKECKMGALPPLLEANVWIALKAMKWLDGQKK